jgi:hypothetical protein
VACGRGRAEDNRARVVLERVPKFTAWLDQVARQLGEDAVSRSRDHEEI